MANKIDLTNPQYRNIIERVASSANEILEKPFTVTAEDIVAAPICLFGYAIATRNLREDLPIEYGFDGGKGSCYDCEDFLNSLLEYPVENLVNMGYKVVRANDHVGLQNFLFEELL